MSLVASSTRVPTIPLLNPKTGAGEVAQASFIETKVGWHLRVMLGSHPGTVLSPSAVPLVMKEALALGQGIRSSGV